MLLVWLNNSIAKNDVLSSLILILNLNNNFINLLILNLVIQNKIFVQMS